jgi:preprotein translocase subunit SecG
MKLFKLFFLIFFFQFFAIFSVNAQLLKDGVVDEMDAKVDLIRGNSYGDQTLQETVAIVIQIFLSLLGVIFVILMILGGYNWMTAGGDESKVEKARNTIQRAVIGLAIVLLAYAITYFIFTVMPGSGEIEAGGSGTTPPP